MRQPLDRDPMRPWCLDVDAAPLRPPRLRKTDSPEGAWGGAIRFVTGGCIHGSGRECACFFVKHSGITFSCTFSFFEGNPLNILVDSSHLCRSEIKRVLQQHFSLSLLPSWPRSSSSGKQRKKRKNNASHTHIVTRLSGRHVSISTELTRIFFSCMSTQWNSGSN